MEPQHIISIEVHHSIEAGEGSSSHDQTATATAKKERIEMLKGAGAQPGAVEAAKIQKVIFLLRDHDHFVKYFEPRVASIGPIHHGNPKYELGEKYKLRLAYQFVQGLSCNNGDSLDHDINHLYKKIMKEIKKLRECFEEEVTKKYDDETLAWMLFVDGCAILQYIFCAANYYKFEELSIKNDSVAFAQQDLFLLENQVPYCLLKLLMNLSGKEDELSKSIERFIGSVTYQNMTPQQKEGEHSGSQSKQPTHLLDLLRTRLLGNNVQKEQKSKYSSPSRSSKSNPPSGKTRGIWPCRKKGEEDLDWQSYRNVQELKSAGIQLRRSKNRSLRNIRFTRLFNFYPGYLWLPPITVDDSTGPKFMNLIAYEMCLDFENDFGISSYMSFLDSLILDANDIKYMREAAVLYNFLGSDQEVADLFYEIGTKLANAEAYKDVKFQIQEYYINSWIIWLIRMSQFYHDHFSTPWSTTNFVCSIVLVLILTAIQTWYTVYPPRGRDP